MPELLVIMVLLEISLQVSGEFLPHSLHRTSRSNTLFHRPDKRITPYSSENLPIR